MTVQRQWQAPAIKMRWNIVGDNFTHTSGGHTGKCAVHGKMPRYIEWCFNREADITFYTDRNIINGVDDRDSSLKFGWLLESLAMRPAVVREIKSNHQAFFKTYRCIFTHNQELLALDRRFKFCPAQGFWIKEVNLHRKSRLVSMISSNKRLREGHRWRLQFLEQHRDQFDLYGNGFRHISRKEIGLNDYMFSVAIENGAYATYFTEKVLDCFATGTVPIYRGAPDIGDYFNADGIIMIDDRFCFGDLSPQRYESMRDAVEDNFARVCAYEIVEDWIYQTYKDELFC